MTDVIKEKVMVRGDVGSVFAALTEQAGYTGWWSKDCNIGREVGDESQLKFDKEGMIVNMRFRVDDVVKNKRVRWTCIAHDMPSWVGTTLSWEISPDSGATEVSLEHSGWKDGVPEPVVQGWRHFVGSLRSFVETGAGQPW